MIKTTHTAFNQVSLTVQLPLSLGQGGLVFTRSLQDPTLHVSILDMSSLTSLDLSVLEGAVLDLSVGGQVFSVQIEQDMVMPDLGGRIVGDVFQLLSGGSGQPAEVIILAGGLSQEGQLTIQPEPAAGQEARLAALKRQNLISLGPGREIQLRGGSSLLKPAQVILPYDPALIPLRKNTKRAGMAYYNPGSEKWEMQKLINRQANVMTAEVSHFSLYKPVFQMPDGAVDLREAYAYPNPAVAPEEPVIRAVLGKVDAVEITIYDIAGKKVHSAVLNGDPSGAYDNADGYEYYYDYTWEGPKASGVYFAVIHGKTAEETVRARTEFAVVR